MGKLRDLTGQRFGRLTAIKFVGHKRIGIRQTSQVLWLCKCDCGKETIKSSQYLKNGTVKSCGCLKIEICKSKSKHNLSTSRLYSVWSNMKDRCNNPKSTFYRYYGGQGISVCNEWQGENGSSNFINWALEHGYSENLTIERIDGSKGYSPNNCKWIPQSEQSRNRSNTHFITYKGETLTLSEWQDKLKIARETIRKFENEFDGRGDIAIYYLTTRKGTRISPKKFKEIKPLIIQKYNESEDK